MNWNPLESGTIAGDSPVQVKIVIDSGILSSAGHVKPCMNLPGPSGRLNTSERPIVNQYREGKVKRTLNKGVK